MSDRIEIDFTANTKAVEEGANKISDSLKDVEGSLGDVQNSGKELSASLIKNMIEAGRAAGKSADQIQNDLEKAFDIPAEAARKMARISKTELENIEASSSKVENSFGKIEEASGKVGSSIGDIGSVAKDVLDGDVGGAISGVSTALGGISPVAGIAAGAIGAVLGSAFASISEQSATMKEDVSTNFRQMAAEGITAWESLKSQSERLTDAYDKHADEINKIADLVGLPFETVAAAWAGNKDAIDAVTAAQNEMNAETRKIPGVSVDAAAATTKGWEGVLAPLKNAISGYDEARTKAERLAAQQKELSDAAASDAEASSARSQAAEKGRFDALTEAHRKASELPPIQIKADVDMSAAEGRVKNFVEKNYSINVLVDAITRNGQKVL